jgi:hypothetical protein
MGAGQRAGLEYLEGLASKRMKRKTNLRPSHLYVGFKCSSALTVPSRQDPNGLLGYHS